MIPDNVLTYGERRNQEGEPLTFGTAVKEVLKATMAVGLTFLTIAYGTEHVLKVRDTKAIEKKCSWIEATAANKGHIQYRADAREITKYPHIDLGKTVGFSRLQRRIAEANEDRKLRIGEKYKTLDCNTVLLR